MSGVDIARLRFLFVPVPTPTKALGKIFDQLNQSSTSSHPEYQRSFSVDW